ncbi:MAG TPA: BMP family ABC transporter substrate-binding protein [Acidilobales archaeon]|nr:BMP family ABC transporter substrate-binding protein [Acidilobales archaeon]
MVSTKVLIGIVIVVVIIAGLAGYYAAIMSRPAPSPTPTVTTPKKVKMAFIFPGSITDTAWNEAGYRGMEAFRGKHPEVEIAWVQGVYDPAQIESTIRSYVEQGYKLIVGQGFQFGEPMAKLAKEYKDVYFLAVAGAPSYVGPQVSVADVRTDQSCFIAGYLAIKLSNTKHVGFVAGMAVAELSRCEVGLRHGIAYAGYNPDEVLHVVYVGDFHDVPKAKLSTTTLIEQYKVDVIKAMGDGCQLGAISASKEAGVYAMMSGTYHPEVYPEGTVLYEVWHWEVVYEQFYQDYISGKLQKEGGKIYWLDMQNGGLEVVPGAGTLPKELWDEAQQLINKILAGEIDTGFKPE